MNIPMHCNVQAFIHQSNLHSVSLGRKKAPPLASIWARRSLDASEHGNPSALLTSPTLINFQENKFSIQLCWTFAAAAADSSGKVAVDDVGGEDDDDADVDDDDDADVDDDGPDIERAWSELEME